MTESRSDNEPREIAVVDDSMRRVNAVEEIQPLTDFDDQVGENVLAVEERTVVDGNPYIKQTLLQFLERPYPIARGAWSKSDGVGTCLARVSFPDALFGVPPLWAKLQNFQYFRASVHVRVKINATLFHYGKLLGVWRPMALGKTTIAPGAATTADPTGWDNMYSLSSNPHVLISPSTTETQEMQIPFVLPVQWINLGAYSTQDKDTIAGQRWMSNLGVFELWVLNGLQAQGLTTDPPAQYTIYANFFDVELAGYTPRVLTYSAVTLPLFKSVLSPTGFWYSYTSGGVTKEGKAAQAGNDVGTSKDDDSGQLTKIVPFPLQIGSAHVRHPALTLSATQNISAKKMVENSDSLLAYMKVPSLLRTLTINSSTSQGTTITRIPVTPHYYPQGTIAGRSALFKTRVGFLASLFSFWRGTMSYHFQVVCSKFHSLRLRVYWVPDSQVQSPTFADASSSVNRVIDVQGETNFDIDVPWLNYVWAHRAIRSTYSHNGFLQVDLLNPIVYPTTNAPSVFVNVWVAAGPDFEVCKLASWTDSDNAMLEYLGTLDGAAKRTRSGDSDSYAIPRYNESSEEKSRAVKALDVSGKILAQAGEEPALTEHNGAILGSDKTRPIFEQLVGENITRFSDLLTKPSFFATISTKGKIWVAPFVIPTSTNKNLTMGGIYVRNFIEYLWLISCGDSGAIKFLLPAHGSLLGIPWAVSNPLMTIYSNQTTTLEELVANNAATHIAYYPVSSGSGDYQQKAVILPYYSNLNMRPHSVFSWQVDFSYYIPACDLVVRDLSSDTATMLVCGTEQFRLHVLIGPPVMLQVTS